ncbi:PREDICTED: magnesium transporter MRS2-F-like [Tarenaya hassleriana]|uniref:magnesium transporter MRS2-F-like n=1 Tax=Tarenaya hassleriana TaxID=28532 RepID=UPI00053C1653|nr:PREDICTED: magnesium transporter MRS2-F-like [Tarenaya hassleriana]
MEFTRLRDEDPTARIPAAAQAKRVKGSGGVRTWTVVTAAGDSRLEDVGKHSIMRRTGLPARDLRALDPVLSYPSSILGRERAIVVNLEHIKCIITAKEVFLLNSTNPLVVLFVSDLIQRIQQAGEGNGVQANDGVDDAKCSISPPENIDTAIAIGPKVLPFEFKALEACLESACRCLESETRTLEEEAYPALDELTSKISTLNLDRVRQIKSRLVTLSGRVQKVRDELEHLLDDDNDMAQMYLTEMAESPDQASLKEDSQDDASESDEEREDEIAFTNSEMIPIPKPNIEELEMLLEAYFAQIDGILQKLSGMSEDVEDTEDYINIMLDDKQNQLLQMGVMLSTGNMILNAGIVVVGLLGMNIHISLFDGKPLQFWETALGTIVGCVGLYLVAIGWGKKKNLLAL